MDGVGGFPGGRFGGAAPALPGYGGGGPGHSSGYGSVSFDAPVAQPSYQAHRPNNFHSRSLGLLVALPSVLFALNALAFALAFHARPAVCWSFTIFCLGLSALFMLARQKNGAPRFWFNVGTLCLLATVAATLTGLWNYFTHFDIFWAYEGQRTYADVGATDPAVNYLDAGKLFFSAGAKVDQALSVGIAEGADRYCVAPIMRASAAETSRPTVQFWAAGVNCCGPSGSFACWDDSGNSAARAGLVYLDYGPRRRPLDHLRRAAREASASHGLQTTTDALFVDWVANPADAQQEYWHSGMMFLLGACLTYVALAAVMGAMLHFGPRGESQGRDKILRSL